MKRKTWCLLTLGALLTSFALLSAVVIFIDPFQIYRKAERYLPPIDNKTQVYSNAGIVRQYDYDSIVVGTSVTENFRPSQLDSVLGGRFIKLSSSAGTAYNHAILMDLAFRTHDVKRVVYGLDVYSFVKGTDETGTQMPMYLYDDNLFNDAAYWLNRSVLASFIPRCLRTWGQTQTDALRDTMYNWQDQYTYGPEALWDIQFKAAETQKNPGEYIDILYENLETHLLPYIKSNPQTQFDIFFPPYSAAEWVKMAGNGTFDALLALRRLCYSHLSGYANVRIYDFAAKEEWVTDIDNYKDPLHYAQWINDAIAECIARGENLVTDSAQIEDADAQLRAWVDMQLSGGRWPFH
ncbi:MAG: hypothetical protein IKU34_04855 [Clostridia bacterium]|nr:hypothetical protein [Clostridia bacterium]